MADYGLNIWNENGDQIFSEDEYSMEVLDTFTVTNETGSRTVSGLTDDCVLELGYTGGLSAIENIYISGSKVHWQGSVLSGYDDYRGDVNIHVTVLKRRT